MFLEKSFTKCVAKTIPSPFSKKSKLSISLDQYSKDFVFIVCIVIKRNPSLETRAASVGFSISLSVHVQI